MSRQERAAFGAQLRARRQEQGMSQRALADAIGVDPSMISRVEKGERELSATQLAGVIDVLGDLDVGPGTLDPASRKVRPELIEDVAWALANTVRGALGPAEGMLLVTTIAFLKCASDLNHTVEGPGPQLEVRWETIAHSEHISLRGRIRRAWQVWERENPFLRGAFDERTLEAVSDLLPKIVAELDDINFSPESAAEDDGGGNPFGRFIDAFVTAHGPLLGEVATPSSIVSLVTALLGRSSSDAFDPTCGTGTLLASVSGQMSEEASAGLGQEINPTIARVALLNLAAHRTPAQVEVGDSLRDDHWPNLRAELVVSNPPFRQKGWSDAENASDPRWRYGLPPLGDATFAWLQHALHHLRPDGRAAVVLPAGAMWQGGPSASIRRGLVEAGELTTVVALPARLFASTGIESCLWIVDRGLNAGQREPTVLMIDATRLGRVKRRRGQVALANDEINAIAAAYRAWSQGGSAFEPIPGLAASVGTSDIRAHDYMLGPNRYVRDAEVEPADLRERLQTLARAVEEDSRAIAELEARIFPLLREFSE